jgi:hypothetical protein
LAAEWLRKSTPAEVEAKIVDVLFKMPKEATMTLYQALDKRAGEDATGEFERIWKRITDENVLAAVGCPDEVKAKVREKWMKDTPETERKASKKGEK